MDGTGCNCSLLQVVDNLLQVILMAYTRECIPHLPEHDAIEAYSKKYLRLLTANVTLPVYERVVPVVALVQYVPKLREPLPR